MTVERLHIPKSETLRRIFWRSEILQVMYWLHGEGLGDIVDAATLDRFLGISAAEAVPHLDRLVTDGYLIPIGDTYTLSQEGLREGAAEFATSFAELTKPGHGECSADCWCHASPDEAAACFEARHEPHDHA
ncbi:hypothetical protein BH24ACT15_BH24ACT15_19570 [soil metagenome]